MVKSFEKWHHDHSGSRRQMDEFFDDKFNDTESNYSETSEATIPYGEVENAGVEQNFKSWYSTEGEQADVDSRTGSLRENEMVS